MAHKQKVLVAGATGYLGRYVAQEFKRRGYWVRVLARAPEKLQSVGPYMEPAIDQLCDELFVGEVTRPETLKGVCVDIAKGTQNDVEQDVGGQAAYTYEDIGTLACDIVGVNKKIVRIPLWLARLAVTLIRPFSSHWYQAARFFTTVMSNDFVAPKAGSYTLDRYFEEMFSQV